MRQYCSDIWNKWSEIPYPGQERVYHGIDVNAGSWPLMYLIRRENHFESPKGEKITFDLAHPSSFDFKSELIEVEDVQTNITKQQIAMAKYWGNGVPVMQITPIILALISTYKITPARAGRIMASVNNTINDAFVITWYYKYLFDYPRPVQLNIKLKTVISTPIFPTYPSGHSVVSGAVQMVLSYYFPSEAEKLNQIAEDASISRLYGGIHYNCDLKQGLRLGRQIGSIIVEYLKSQEDKDNTMIDIPKTIFLDAPIMPKYE